ncbi:MAG: glycine/betaine ABC transporter permease [Gaiellaceae bacterium]|jgi:glycine betaine/proline transport system permease protein|nr:MAG: glycine/betaine ABC transporter permease [Gaiellaceae bacterium]
MASVAADTVSTRPLSHRPWWRGRLVGVGVVVALMVASYRLGVTTDANGVAVARFPWPEELVWNAFPGHLDAFQTWLLDQRNAEDPSIVFALFNGFATLVDSLVSWLDRFLLWLTWVGTAATATLVALRFGGVRAAAWVAGALAAFALMGLWEESMQTVALMLAAVALSLAVGIPVGIAAGLSTRVQRAVTPVLDTMQIVPAFAYLMPVVILFSVGPGAAVVATMIYAIPPAVRITALGIRSVAPNTVEAATSLGATRPQILAKVQLPLARRMLMLGVNQTILFALSMVVIAGLIGGGGLGDLVTSGLYSSPAMAILAGAAIVIVAMALDRATEATASRTDPTRRHLDDSARRTLRFLTVGAAAAAAASVALAKELGAPAAYPEGRSAQEWLLARIQSALDYVQDPARFLFAVTEPLGNAILVHLVQPLQSFLILGPWFTTLAGVTAIALVVSGVRPALTTLAMFVAIGVVGMWEPAMDTFSQVLVATGIAVAIGIALGIAASESALVSRALRPVNDVLQTLPQLVYIIPFVYLMPVSIVPGIVAGVLYAFPVVVRLVERGLRDVAPEAVEAASAFGASRTQLIAKVKVPLAGDAIMLGINQGIIMVLAVVVIGGLVGSGGLGYLVTEGLVRGQFGQGVAASLAILALGIALDRVTQATRQAGKEVLA